MKRRFLLSIICLAIVYSGCAVKSENAPTTVISTPAVAESDSPDEGLPDAHGPLGRKHRATRPIEETFLKVESLEKTNQFTVVDIRSIRSAGFSAFLLSKCDLDVLKCLIASDWPPLVIIRSPVGPKHVRVVMGYSDPMSQVTIADPRNFAEARLKYDDFIKQWDDPRKSCLIVFPHNVVEDRIRSVLKKYLPAEKAEAVIIRK